jgi:hypothetical protein
MLGLDLDGCSRFQATAVETQALLPTPEAARDVAIASAQLPEGPWTVASSTDDAVEYRFLVDGQVRAGIAVGRVPPSPGSPTAGWTVQTAQRCLE